MAYKSTSVNIQLTLVLFFAFIFLKIGEANTKYVTQITLVLFYFWLLSILFFRSKTVIQILHQSHYLALFVFVLFLFFGLSASNGIFTSVKGIGAYLQIYAPIFMYEFYIKFFSKKTQRIIIIIIFCIYIFYSLQTIEYLQSNPSAARDMVSIGVPVSLMIGGGFSLAYGFSILLPVLLYIAINYSKSKEKLVYNKPLTRFILIIIILIFWIVVYKSMFAISFLVMIFGGIYALFRMNKAKKTNNFWFLGIIILSVLLYITASQFMSFLNNFLSSFNTVITRKLIIILNLSHYSNINDTGSLGARIEFYLESLNTWTSHPFFGIGYKYDFSTPKMMAAGLGNHSEWLDSLAKYGIFIIFLLIYIFKPKKVYKNIQGYKLGLILFVITGFLNPIHLFNIYFVVFFFVPLLDNYFFNQQHFPSGAPLNKQNLQHDNG